jgi:hypothetical protein
MSMTYPIKFQMPGSSVLLIINHKGTENFLKWS